MKPSINISIATLISMAFAILNVQTVLAADLSECAPYVEAELTHQCGY